MAKTIPIDPAPFRLRAMTLRGVGSYYWGTRLELARTTILCGKNGSGKSTWLKALDTVIDAAEAGILPFAFRTVPSGAKDTEHQWYHAWAWWYGAPHPRYARPDEDEEFGGVGTIGFEADSQVPFTSGVSLPLPDSTPGTASPLWTYLRGDKLPPATGILFRFSPMRGRGDSDLAWCSSMLRVGDECARLDYTGPDESGQQSGTPQFTLTWSSADVATDSVPDGQRSAVLEVSVSEKEGFHRLDCRLLAGWGHFFRALDAGATWGLPQRVISNTPE